MKLKARKKLLKRLPCYYCLVYPMCKVKYIDKSTIECTVLAKWICKFDYNDSAGWSRIQKIYPHVTMVDGKNE
jgi:hypothetical protein